MFESFVLSSSRRRVMPRRRSPHRRLRPAQDCGNGHHRFPLEVFQLDRPPLVVGEVGQRLDKADELLVVDSPLIGR